MEFYYEKRKGLEEISETVVKLLVISNTVLDSPSQVNLYRVQLQRRRWIKQKRTREEDRRRKNIKVNLKVYRFQCSVWHGKLAYN